MSNDSNLEQELHRRIIELETSEAADGAHAALSGRSLSSFLGIAAAIVVIAWVGAAL